MYFPARPACHEVPQAAILIEVKRLKSLSVIFLISSRNTRPESREMRPCTVSRTTTSEQTFDFANQSARYVRYLGHGATLNAGGTSTWNSVTEMSVFAP